MESTSRCFRIVCIASWFFPKFSINRFESLRSYPNIHFRRLNFRNYSLGTPAAEFLATDTIFKSKYLVPTFSDILRLITLYHFGGIYFDLDAVILKVKSTVLSEFIKIIFKSFFAEFR